MALQDQFVAVIKQVTPSVVEIETSSGLGSGVIYDTKGDIVTNAHVVGTETTFTVTLSDGRSFPGTLVGTYTPDDIAVCLDRLECGPELFGTTTNSLSLIEVTARPVSNA